MYYPIHGALILSVRCRTVSDTGETSSFYYRYKIPIFHATAFAGSGSVKSCLSRSSLFLREAFMICQTGYNHCDTGARLFKRRFRSASGKSWIVSRNNSIASLNLAMTTSNESPWTARSKLRQNASHLSSQPSAMQKITLCSVRLRSGFISIPNQEIINLPPSW
jgi:hypothetical protein